MMAHPISQFPFSATFFENVVAPMIKDAVPFIGTSPHVLTIVSPSYVCEPITNVVPIGQWVDYTPGDRIE